MPVTGTAWGKTKRQFSARRARVRGALLVLLAGAPAALAWVVFTEWMPSSADEYAAYRATSVCDGPVRAGDDCLRDVPMRVDKVKRHRKGSRDMTATTTEAPFWTYETSFGADGPLADGLHKGDEITGTTWRDHLVGIAKGEVRQHTTDEPRDEPQPQAAIGTYDALLAGLLLTIGTVRLVRPRKHPRFLPSPYPRRLALSVGAVSGVVGIVGLATRMPWWLTPPLIVLVSAPVVHLILNWTDEPKLELT
ncbi:monovalent cation/H(+) antiporter subunit G [Streptomyces acidiscabies]|uniref:monovalent cation/H(+) antiporter subunit G n=1 Tax=Streptomyces acidiscabies TaxID=42234 RepID=UPI000953490C|nr:monovalent cation/H(+) antiporter subunit G [Streptomyces acidiscabies]